MADITEQEVWEDGIYRLETTDPVEGGENGVDNLPHKQLAARTLWLKAQVALKALVGGSATQKFKVASATAADEAVNKAQATQMISDSLVGVGGKVLQIKTVIHSDYYDVTADNANIGFSTPITKKSNTSKIIVIGNVSGSVRLDVASHLLGLRVTNGQGSTQLATTPAYIGETHHHVGQATITAIFDNATQINMTTLNNSGLNYRVNQNNQISSMLIMEVES